MTFSDHLPADQSCDIRPEVPQNTSDMRFNKMSSIILCVVLMGMAVSAYPAGQYGPPHVEHYEDRDYKFSYSVKDDPTYNHQTREENKYGNTVTGQYTVLEPTGDLRVVNYVADDGGFRAEVQNQAGYQKTAYAQ